MFGDGSLTFQEFAIREPLPLARIQEAALEFLRHRDDAVLFGAQAINAYVDEPRMTQDVDILSNRAAELAEELRQHLSDQFHIAVCVRAVAGGKGFRIYQMREQNNRHLADIRSTSELPPHRLVADVRVPVPEALIAQKVISYASRVTQPKGDTDRRDLKVMLLAFPTFKTPSGPVLDHLKSLGADTQALAAWQELAHMNLQQNAPDDEGF